MAELLDHDHGSCGPWCSFEQVIVARASVQLGHAFDLHIAVLELPIVVGLEENGADEPYN